MNKDQNRLSIIKETILSAIKICQEAGWEIDYLGSYIVSNNLKKENKKYWAACPLLCVVLVHEDIYRGFDDEQGYTFNSYLEANTILNITSEEFRMLDEGLSGQEYEETDFYLLGREIMNEIDNYGKK